MDAMFSSICEAENTITHTVLLTQDHEISVPKRQLYLSSCCNVAVGLRGNVSQDHPDSHTSGSCSLVTEPDICCCRTRSVTRAMCIATHRFCSMIEIPVLNFAQITMHHPHSRLPFLTNFNCSGNWQHLSFEIKGSYHTWSYRSCCCPFTHFRGHSGLGRRM